MNTIARRFASSSTRSLVPPPIASPNAIGAPKDAARMSRVVSFYSKLPKGPAQFKNSGLWSAYKTRYFDAGKESGAPLLHAIAVLFLMGYSFDYYFHLRAYIV